MSVALRSRLTDREASTYAAQLRSLGYRVTVVPIFADTCFIEVRRPAGERGQRPPNTLRTAEDCREFLRSIPT